MSTVRLCVATFGEDVRWVESAGIEACIYDATGLREGLIPVPNEAREASQYLRHVVENHDNLRDYEVFLQGAPRAHHPSILTMLRNRLWEGSRCFPLGRRVAQWHEGVAAHREAAEILARDSGIAVPNGTTWVPGAMFAASREALQARPRGWWEQMLGRVIIERGVSPWAMERLWLTILGFDHQR